MFRCIIFCCLYFIAIAPYIHAMTDEQKANIAQHFEEASVSCMTENPLTTEEAAALRAATLPTGANVPCFVACMFQKVGLMDDKGMLQKENGLELVKKIFHDEEELKSMHDFLHSCSYINSQAVSDGDKGCERAVLSFKCMLDNASQFGFQV